MNVSCISGSVENLLQIFARFTRGCARNADLSCPLWGCPKLGAIRGQAKKGGIELFEHGLLLRA